MKDEKILVTGSSGFIGSSLINSLRDSKISNKGLDKYGVGKEQLNLSDKEGLEKILNEYNKYLEFLEKYFSNKNSTPLKLGRNLLRQIYD